jgi:hypothetical protein
MRCCTKGNLATQPAGSSSVARQAVSLRGKRKALCSLRQSSPRITTPLFKHGPHAIEIARDDRYVMSSLCRFGDVESDLVGSAASSSRVIPLSCLPRDNRDHRLGGLRAPYWSEPQQKPAKANDEEPEKQVEDANDENGERSRQSTLRQFLI